MNIVRRALVRVAKALQLQAISGTGGWWPAIRESFTGAWQSNIEVRLTDVLSHPTVFACISLIASDISKNRCKLVRETADGIWEEVESPSFSPILRKPNHYQTRIQFYESWIVSKLCHGNTYILQARDERNVVVGRYVLDPNRVKVLVAPDGGVFYELLRDDLSHQPLESIIVPAKDMIHDIYLALYHPLIGVSPIYACGVAAIQALRIQTNQTNLFVNGATPGGVLTAAGFIKQETADRVKAYWDTNFTGENSGKVAVLGDGLKFERMALTAVDTDLIKQLQWADEKICSCFHVPGYMVGVGPIPTYDNVEVLARVYYSQCLQVLFEKIELLQDEGAGLMTAGFGTEFDLDNLLRMDSGRLMSTLAEGVKAALLKPNEGRQRLNLRPVSGGDTPYLQEQNWPLRDLADRPLPDRPITLPAELPAPEESVDIEAALPDLLRKELELTAA